LIEHLPIKDSTSKQLLPLPMGLRAARFPNASAASEDFQLPPQYYSGSQACEFPSTKSAGVAPNRRRNFILFGPWEQIFYGEFDGKRQKRVLIKIIGE
jgi:hypothetical protein